MGPPHGSVKHLGLELCELALKLGVVIGQSLDNRRVPGPQRSLVSSSQILVTLEKNKRVQMCPEILLISTFQGANKVCPELCFLCERNVLGIEVKGGHSEKMSVSLSLKVPLYFTLRELRGN